MIGVLWVTAVVLFICGCVLFGERRHAVAQLRYWKDEASYWNRQIATRDGWVSEASEKNLRAEGALAASREDLSRSDAENAALRSELAELKTYADGLKAEKESLKRTSAPTAKKNLPPKIVGRKAKQ